MFIKEEKENELKVYRYDIATKNCKIIVSLSQNIINKEMMFVIQDNIIFGENDRSKIIKEKLWSCIGTWTSTIEILGLL